MTNASLFASSTFLPAFTADNVGNNPAAPTIAAMTISASGCALNSQMACWPANTWVESWCAANFSRKIFAALSSAKATKCGRNFRHFSNIASTLEPPTKANASYFSGLCSITERVLLPMEPVAPRITTFCLFCIKFRPYFINISDGWKTLPIHIRKDAVRHCVWCYLFLWLEIEQFFFFFR